ncbi:hypothetical protein BC826DRAFT_565664 [Russula brevipes]|nr:hypothetical protein BC826DRAFT_565664 [Russula brevipes]
MTCSFLLPLSALSLSECHCVSVSQRVITTNVFSPQFEMPLDVGNITFLPRRPCASRPSAYKLLPTIFPAGQHSPSPASFSYH